jgi:SAM-dependent methyltransferase
MTTSKSGAEDPVRLTSHEVQRFYDEIYHRGAGGVSYIPRHLCRLARLFEPWRGRKLLDVACGTGEWLMAVNGLGAITVGIDISQVALDACNRYLTNTELHCSPAENLPFGDREFDFISCLGALEHFLDPQSALREMVRVAKPNAMFLLLVPNSGFLTQRLGLYRGTDQVDLREEARSLEGWKELFQSAGLRIERRWRDLHVLSTSWIFRAPWYQWPIRAGQALVLPIWPLAWQYQVYHLCSIKN